MFNPNTSEWEPVSEPAKRVIKSIPRPTVPNNIPGNHYQLGEPSDQHVYTDQRGEPIVVVYRFDGHDNSDNSDNSDKSPGKEFRPYTIALGKWCAPEVRPLYRLDALAKVSGPVVLVEGEKCADALNALGILATSAFGGCNGVSKTDFEPLRNREVIIWPDNDEPGFKYADACRFSLVKVLAKSVAVVPLDFEGVPLTKGWDVADAIAAGWGYDEIQNALVKAIAETKNLRQSDNEDSLSENPLTLTGIVSETKPVNVTGNWGEPDMSVLNPRQKPPEFPLQLFGPFWSKWILAKAEGCSAPVDYVGMSLLSLLSGLVGCSRRIRPWGDWQEPPILWIALVGSPSSGKSPALESVLGMVRKFEQEGAEAVKDKLRQHEADVFAAQCERKEWEGQVKEATKNNFPIPPLPEKAQEPNKPERPRIIASDTTPEALARLLSCQPKGLLITRDELAGWLGSFNRYSGGQGGDRAFWLEAFGGKPYVIDRARNGGESVTVPSLGASVIGGIQPDKLQSLLLSGDDDGLPARFLYCWPDPVPLERPQGMPESHEAETALRWLNGLVMIPDGEGGHSHGTVELTEEAAAFFQAWRAPHAANQPDGAIAGWWGKMPGVCLRLALCFEYLKLSSTTRQETFSLDIYAVEAATVMIEQYLKPMAERAYGDAALSKTEKNAATLAKWIVKSKPERINTRVLQREIRLAGLLIAQDINGAVDVLVEAGWLENASSRDGLSKGKGTSDFVVCPMIVGFPIAPQIN